jgi:hypothetical protein
MEPTNPKRPQDAPPPPDIVVLSAIRCLVDGVEQAALGAYLFHQANPDTLGAIVVLLQGVITELKDLPIPTAPKGAKKEAWDGCPPPFILCDGSWCSMTPCPGVGHGKDEEGD